MHKTKTWRIRNIPVELTRRFKAACCEEGITMGEGLVEAVSDWLRKHNNKKEN